MDIKFTLKGFEFSVFVDTETGNPQQRIGEVVAHIQIALATFAQHHIVPDVVARPTAGNGTGQATAPGYTEETWTATKLIHGFFKNRHTFNVCGGRWEQYGVPIYDDIQDIDPILKQDIFSRPLGETPFTREITAVIGPDGKPKKVKKIE